MVVMAVMAAHAPLSENQRVKTTTTTANSVCLESKVEQL